MLNFGEKLTLHDLEQLELCANHLKGLALDAAYAANSGHIGLPLGCARLGAYLFAKWLRVNKEVPDWLNRDRFILSAGHGSLLLYACLHFAGYPIPLDEFSRYRSFDSLLSSHPELRRTPGIEATTGVDGQGIGFGVGKALAMKMLSARIEQGEQKLFDTKVVVLAGDGCLMEGVAAESSSLAGHLCLDNLIVFFDSNRTTLDGFVNESCTEDIEGRYRAYGWEVKQIDGNCFVDLHAALSDIRENQTLPTLFIINTITGHGIEEKSGTPLAHGWTLSDSEWLSAKARLGITGAPFEVDPLVYEYFDEWGRVTKGICDAWKKRARSKGLNRLIKPFVKRGLSLEIRNCLANQTYPPYISGREASHQILQVLAPQLPSLIGGSADLARSDKTYLDEYSCIQADDYSGRNIKYGVREFAMGTISCGMALTGCFIPFVGTFLAFSDYMRSAIRLTSMMRQKVVYQLTHDSLFIGQDGPTHQPVEQLMSLRLIPNLLVLRPADANEVGRGWVAALEHDGPTALILSRQSLPVLQETAIPYDVGLKRGAYWLLLPPTGKGIVIVATGSEVALGLKVGEELQAMNYRVGVISMPSWELFEDQDKEYQNLIFGKKDKKYVALEASCGVGWERYVGREGLVLSVDQFGIGGQVDAVQDHFGFSIEKVKDRIIKWYR